MSEGTVTIKRTRQTYKGGIQTITVRAVGTAADITRLHTLGRVEVGAMHIGRGLWEARLAGDQDELLKRTDQELQDELNALLERSPEDPIRVVTLLHALAQLAAEPSDVEVQGLAQRLSEHLDGRGRVGAIAGGMSCRLDTFAMYPRTLAALLMDVYNSGFAAAKLSSRVEQQIRSTVPPCGVCGEGRVFVTLPCPHCGATVEGVKS